MREVPAAVAAMSAPTPCDAGALGQMVKSFNDPIRSR